MGNKVCCNESNTIDNQQAQAPPIIQFIPFQPIKHEPQKIIQLPHVGKKIQDVLNHKQFSKDRLSKLTNKKMEQYEGGVYQGELNASNQPHGLGTMYKLDPKNHQSCNAIYVGQFKNGGAQGRGAYIFQDGSYVQGPFHENFPKGTGQFKKESGETYEMTFADNKVTGVCKQSKLQFQFEGDYLNGRKQRGVFRWNESTDYQTTSTVAYKNTYSGQFNDRDQFEGVGILTSPLGQYYGQFKNDQKHGKGKFYILKDGKRILRYEGTYKENIKQGSGTIFKNDGTSIAYRGAMSKNLPHGEGEVFSQGKFKRAIFHEGINTEYMQNLQHSQHAQHTNGQHQHVSNVQDMQNERKIHHYI